MTPAEWPSFWDGINDLFGDKFDPAGRSAALCYGRHARRSADAPYRREIFDGAAVNVDAVIAHGRSLRPHYDETQPKSTWKPKRKLAEELERMKLRGAVLPPDNYDNWFKWAGACKRAFPDDPEGAFKLFEAYSDNGAWKDIDDLEARVKKFGDVDAEYHGPADPVTIEMLDWRVRSCAKQILRRVYSPASPEAVVVYVPPGAKTDPAFFEDWDPSDVLGKRVCATDDPAPPGSSPRAGDGMAALEYLLFCWVPKVHDPIIAELKVPAPVLEEARRRTEERRERIDLDGRTLFHWDGRNLATNTTDLANATIDANAPVYKYDRILVRVSNPSADPVHAARLRKIRNYQGPPGGKDDPVQGGVQLTPVLETETIRTIIAEHIATKIAVKTGSGKNATVEYVISSFGFNSKDIRHGPDASVLRDLYKRALPERAPEITGVVTASVMPNLPVSTLQEDLTRDGADQLLTRPGYDAASRLYFAPLRTLVTVPTTPTPQEVHEAAELLKLPLLEFPFAAPAEDLPKEVSFSVALYGTFIAVNRPVLPIAPAFGVTSHGEGASQGKTLLGGLMITYATGRQAIPAGFSTDYTEQGKETVAT
jgi:hypothetical protein